jgi:hypothetical protein
MAPVDARGGMSQSGSLLCMVGVQELRLDGGKLRMRRLTSVRPHVVNATVILFFSIFILNRVASDY